MAEDWVTDLTEFAPQTVARACAEWRRSQSKRPTIADIRKLCIEDREIYSPQPRHDALSGPDARDAYARSVGFSSWLERQDAIDAQQEAYRKAEAWRAAGGMNQPQGTMSPAAALGVTAREYTPSEMSQARTELGMEE